MFRLLVICLLIYLGLRVLKGMFFLSRVTRRSPFQPPAPVARDAGGPVETLVECQTCHTYFNPSQGLQVRQKYYCNEKCASLKS